MCAHTNSLKPLLFIEVPVPSQISEGSCIHVHVCKQGLSMLPLSMIFYKILELFRQYGVFLFILIVNLQACNTIDNIENLNYVILLTNNYI